MSCGAVVLHSALILLAAVATAGPVKTARTLVTDAEIAAWQADSALRGRRGAGATAPSNALAHGGGRRAE